MVISFSGLGESEACWTRRFIRGIGRSSVPLSPKTLTLAAGASHAPTFSKKTTHLLCPSRQGPKAEKAAEWGIPIIDTPKDLLMSAAGSLEAEDDANPAPSLRGDQEGGVVRAGLAPKPVLKRAFFRLTPLTSFSLTEAVKVDDAEDAGGIESNQQETIPLADNSIAPEFEFYTNNFLGRSTPRKGQPLRSEPTLGGDAESCSLHLSSTSTHTEGWEPVPSSRSPSPMVLKKSPSKEAEREQRAHQAITESITTLLGKRQASKEEVVTTGHNGRVTKRSRPLIRNRVQNFSCFPEVELTPNSQSLNKEKERAAEEVEVDSFVFGTPKSGAVFHPVLLEPGAEDSNRGLMEEPLKDDDMRVTYEDLRQREERQRLALILGGKEENAPKPRGKRRSTRLAGF